MSIFKRFYVYLLISLFTFILIPNQTQAENVTLSETGITVEGRTLVPLRAIFEELGVSVN